MAVNDSRSSSCRSGERRRARFTRRFSTKGLAVGVEQVVDSEILARREAKPFVKPARRVDLLDVNRDALLAQVLRLVEDVAQDRPADTHPPASRHERDVDDVQSFGLLV